MSQLLVAFPTHTASGDSCPQVALQPWCLAARPLILQASCGLSRGQHGAELVPPGLVEPACSSNTLSS